MAATFDWNCDHGIAIGSPLRGTTRVVAADNSRKAIDDSSTPATNAPVVAGQNSYSRYLSGKFTGVFNSVGNGFFSANTAGSAHGSGVSLKGLVSSTYSTPSQTLNAALTVDFTSTVAITSGQVVLFSTAPEGASPTAAITVPGSSQFLITQLQTTGSAVAGSTPVITATLMWDEY